jgi:hypothetical protein
VLEKPRYRGGRKEYRAIVTGVIEPKQLGLAGAVQMARTELDAALEFLLLSPG